MQWLRQWLRSKVPRLRGLCRRRTGKKSADASPDLLTDLSDPCDEGIGRPNEPPTRSLGFWHGEINRANQGDSEPPTPDHGRDKPSSQSRSRSHSRASSKVAHPDQLHLDMTRMEVDFSERRLYAIPTGSQEFASRARATSQAGILDGSLTTLPIGDANVPTQGWRLQDVPISPQSSADSQSGDSDSDSRNTIFPSEPIYVFKPDDDPPHQAKEALTLMLDLGSEANIISLQAVRRCGRSFETRDDLPSLIPLQLRSVNTTKIKPLGVVRNVDWHIARGEISYRNDFLVADTDQFDALLGFASIREHRLLQRNPSLPERPSVVRSLPGY